MELRRWEEVLHQKLFEGRRKQRKLKVKNQSEICNFERNPDEKDRKHTEVLESKYEISEDLRKVRKAVKTKNHNGKKGIGSISDARAKEET
ncbi:hypothetical protein NPIL_427981 [Nephila pilipes]|uniref:Uncharacterized protein n=1 Tax=Nephila pilipes TaxID=299642 RepID=A0A8X6TPT1_NEPPI|nr:hypothetical protein NPIL_427981 [Nephila pilipes]